MKKDSKKENKIKSNEKDLCLIEKCLYMLLIIISICLLPIIIYFNNVSKIIFPIMLTIEVIAFIIFKKFFTNKDIVESIFSKDKKIKLMKQILFVVLIILTVALAISIALMFKDLIKNGALNYIYQLAILNIIPIALFSLLVIVIFSYTKNDEKDKLDKVDTKEILYKNKNENDNLVKLIYMLFVLITCFVPYIYIIINTTAYFMKTVWIIGMITVVVFGILLSAILRNVKYYKTSYGILFITFLIVSLIGIFINLNLVITFISSYILFLSTVILGLLIAYRYNKKPKLYFILTILLYIILILSVIFVKV